MFVAHRRQAPGLGQRGVAGRFRAAAAFLFERGRCLGICRLRTAVMIAPGFWLLPKEYGPEHHAASHQQDGAAEDEVLDQGGHRQAGEAARETGGHCGGEQDCVHGSE